MWQKFVPWQKFLPTLYVPPLMSLTFGGLGILWKCAFKLRLVASQVTNRAFTPSLIFCRQDGKCLCYNKCPDMSIRSVTSRFVKKLWYTDHPTNRQTIQPLDIMMSHIHNILSYSAELWEPRLSWDIFRNPIWGSERMLILSFDKGIKERPKHKA